MNTIILYKRCKKYKYKLNMNSYLIYTYLVMKTGDNVLISPEVTHKSDWTLGTVIEVEANPFVGTVISAETPSGEIYFDKEYQFKPAY